MPQTIAITGLGIVSALGNTLSSNKEALLQSKSGIEKLKKLDSIHTSQMFVGEVSMTNAEMETILNLPAAHNFTRTALLGSIAALEALKSAKIDKISDFKTGFISATTVGGMDKTEEHFKQFSSQPAAQKYISSHHAGDSTQKIASQLGVTEYTTTVSTACSSAANAIMLAARMIHAGVLERVIVGGTDALSKFTINGFSSLMLASTTHCKPFDAKRNGLNLGEAAAYLVLESETAAKGKKPLAFLAGYGNANDAHHQTASSENGEGAYLAMKKALDVAKIAPSKIAYVNAHGTATLNNDLSESVALQRIFGEHVPDFSSTKAFTGHTLAAAGAVEAVFSVFALQENTIFPNLNFEIPMPETQLVPVLKLKHKELRYVLSNSFGFGGNCTSLVFRNA